jgi:hypothetical protein
MTEAWRPVIGYEGFYEVSDKGRIKSLAANRTRGRWRKAGDRILNPSPGTQGYLRLQLMTGDGARNMLGVGVHGLVAAAFIGPCPDGMMVCHNDGNNQNNHVANLRYDTAAANNQDTLRHGRHVQANQTHCKRGHEYNATNTYYSDRQRTCRICQRDNMRRYRADHRTIGG